MEHCKEFEDLKKDHGQVQIEIGFIEKTRKIPLKIELSSKIIIILKNEHQFDCAITNYYSM